MVLVLTKLFRIYPNLSAVYQRLLSDEDIDVSGDQQPDFIEEVMDEGGDTARVGGKAPVPPSEDAAANTAVSVISQPSPQVRC